MVYFQNWGGLGFRVWGLGLRVVGLLGFGVPARAAERVYARIGVLRACREKAGFWAV